MFLEDEIGNQEYVCLQCGYRRVVPIDEGRVVNVTEFPRRLRSRRLDRLAA
jgi:hypothetical protein